MNADKREQGGAVAKAFPDHAIAGDRLLVKLVRQAFTLVMLLLAVDRSLAFAACDVSGADASAVAAARVAIDAGCKCAAAPTHGAYVSCAAGVLNTRVARNQLRNDCRGTLQSEAAHSACGISGEIGRIVKFQPPPPLDLTSLGLPQLPDGSLFLIGVPNATLAVDPTLRSPVTALGACTGWITSCFDPLLRSLDDCARSAPRCATDQPWNEPACCPGQCFANYQAVRRSGTEPDDAFSAVYFRDASCFPGVRELLGGTR